MTQFTFTTPTATRTLEIGELVADSRLLELKKNNSLPPLERSKSLSYKAPAGSSIVNVSEVILERKGIAGHSFKMVSALSDFANRAQITANFVDLIATAASLSQKANIIALKKALLDLLESQPIDQDLNKEFDAIAYAEFYPGIPDDGDPARGGVIRVRWDFATRRMISNAELVKTCQILSDTIIAGQRIQYSKS